MRVLAGCGLDESWRWWAGVGRGWCGAGAVNVAGPGLEIVIHYLLTTTCQAGQSPPFI